MVYGSGFVGTILFILRVVAKGRFTTAHLRGGGAVVLPAARRGSDARVMRRTILAPAVAALVA